MRINKYLATCELGSRRKVEEFVKEITNIEEGAIDVEENGVYVDEDYGNRLFNLAINSVIFDVEKLLDF